MTMSRMMVLFCLALWAAGAIVATAITLIRHGMRSDSQSTLPLDEQLAVMERFFKGLLWPGVLFAMAMISVGRFIARKRGSQ